METIAIASDFTADQRKRIVSAASHVPQARPVARFVPLDSLELPPARILVGSFRPEALKRLSLRTSTVPAFIQLTSAGYDKYVQPGVLSPKTAVANASGAFDQAVAEHCLAMLMELEHNLELYRDNQHKHVWKDEGPVDSLLGACVLVIGKGHIGTRFARLATALGAHVIGFRRHLPASAHSPQVIAREGRTEKMNNLGSWLSHADVIVSFLPSTPETRGIYNDTFFDMLKPGAYFVNAGRGDAVQMSALWKALRLGRLAGAGLDVTDPEPLPANDSLWSQPNVVITPHVAGGWHLAGTADALCRIACANILRFETHQPLLNQVAGPRI